MGSFDYFDQQAVDRSGNIQTLIYGKYNAASFGILSLFSTAASVHACRIEVKC
jgi:hypothetical protein